MIRELKRTKLLDSLWACQDDHRCINDDDVQRLAHQFQLSAVEVEGVASFYHFFHSQPAGKYTIYLNNSIMSELAGYQEVRQAFEAATGAKMGGVSPVGKFGLFDTPCIGLSDQEPAALINFLPFTRLTPARVRQIVGALKRDVPVAELCDEVEDPIRYTPEPERTVFFRDYKFGRSLEQLLRLTPQEVLEQIKISDLSGRGGAFFPTGLKWELCRSHPGPRYVVCNADEGEPGTFKDRALMNQMPGLLIEGMIIGGYAVGAVEGIIYLRAEYRWLFSKLQKAIDDAREAGWLGEKIGSREPFKFNIRIQLGAGAYVCGEETALLESMEGKRGEPRTRTYFPVERGYLGMPTVVNNVETFCGAARILELGAYHFRSLGTQASSGTKIMSISGDCKRPGLYELEWGMSVGELMALCGAQDPYFVQISGPSGQCIGKSELTRRLCTEDLLCGGSIMVFNSQRDILQILRNFNGFFKHESCGMCTPCRAGNFIFSRKLEKLQNTLGAPEDVVEMRNWGRMMKQASRCGLGQTAPNALLYALDKFPEYFNDLVNHPGGKSFGIDIEKAVADYQVMTKTNGE